MDVHRGQGDREILEQGGLRNGVAEKHCQNVQRGLRVGWPGFTLEETVGTNRRERFWGGVAVAGRGPPQLARRARALQGPGARPPHTCAPSRRREGGASCVPPYQGDCGIVADGAGRRRP